YAGDTSAHGGDDSAADLALCSELAYWTQDPDQIERLWLGSPLGQRAKTQGRADYRRRTVGRALQNKRPAPAPADPPPPQPPNPPAPAPAPADPAAALAPMAALLADTIDTFRRHLHLPDPRPLLVLLGALAANHLEGDPVWLLLVGPPSGGKTRLLESLFPL